MSDKTIIMRNPWGSEVRVAESRKAELESRGFELVNPEPSTVEEFTKKELLAGGKEILGIDYANKLSKPDLIDQIILDLESQGKTEADFVKWANEQRQTR